MINTIPRFVVVIPLAIPVAALFTHEALLFILAGLDLDNHTVPFVAQLRAAVFLASWVALVYWAAWETASIRRTISRTCWAFSAAAVLLPIASVTWAVTSPPYPDGYIITKFFIVVVAFLVGVVLGLLGLLLAIVWSPLAAPERHPVRLLRDTRETLRRIGGARIALALMLLVVGLRVGSAEGFWSEKYTAITTNVKHTCGVRTDGTAHCWGAYRGIPPQDERFVSIAPGFKYACGLREDGSLSCWGTTTNFRGLNMPADLGLETSSGPFTEITADRGHICGLRPDGTIECWRDDEGGEASPPEGELFTDDPGLETSGGPFTEITATGNHICGLRLDGTVVCWGDDQHGEASPPDGELFTEISAGPDHTCGIRPDGTGVCWGSVESPPGSVRFKAISSGWDYACGIRVNEDIVCWGSWESLPELRLSIGGPFVALDTTVDHACGLRPDGSVYCWGASTTYENHNFGSEPVRGDRFVSISTGHNYNCGLRENGTAKCWGGIPLDRRYR